jgi:hypothetical protein
MLLLFQSKTTSPNVVPLVTVLSALSLSPTGTGYVGIGMESIRNVGVSPSLFLPASSATVSENKGHEPKSLLKRYLGQGDLMTGAYSVSCDISTAVSSAGLGSLVSSLMGNDFETQAVSGGLYTHYITPSKKSKSITIETNSNGMKTFRYAGMQTSNMSISCDFGSEASASFSLVGLSSQRLQERWIPQFYDVQPLSYQNAQVLRNNEPLASIVSFNLSISNDLNPKWLVRKQLVNDGFVLMGRTIEISFSVDNDEPALYSDFKNDDLLSISLELEASSSDFVKITLPVVNISDIGDEVLGGYDFSGQVLSSERSPMSISMANPYESVF